MHWNLAFYLSVYSLHGTIEFFICRCVTRKGKSANCPVYGTIEKINHQGCQILLRKKTHNHTPDEVGVSFKWHITLYDHKL